MTDRWGGSENSPYSGRGYTTLTTEQREQLEALHKTFYDETNPLQKDLWDKRAELDTVLNAANPDMDKAKAIQNEISALQAKLAEKRIEFEVEARKINPDAQYGRGYGRGMVNDPRGGTKGSAFGPGACWR
jgi:zinc resistance-associated protein